MLEVLKKLSGAFSRCQRVFLQLRLPLCKNRKELCITSTGCVKAAN